MSMEIPHPEVDLIISLKKIDLIEYVQKVENERHCEEERRSNRSEAELNEVNLMVIKKISSLSLAMTSRKQTFWIVSIDINR